MRHSSFQHQVDGGEGRGGDPSWNGAEPAVPMIGIIPGISLVPGVEINPGEPPDPGGAA